MTIIEYKLKTTNYNPCGVWNQFKKDYEFNTVGEVVREFATGKKNKTDKTKLQKDHK